MTIRDLFDAQDTQISIERINHLTPTTTPEWGKMDVAQMLAHVNVAYDMVYTDKYPPAKGFKRFMITLLAKKGVVGPKPYPKNGRTAPQFLITGQRDFEQEKAKLIENIEKTQKLGRKHFNMKESNSFGALTDEEWNVLFSKHFDHHMRQFGV